MMMIPDACTMDTEQAASQTVGWSWLIDRALSTRPIEGGYQVTFPINLARHVERMVAVEAGCCSFLEMKVTRNKSAIRLKITADDPQNQRNIRSMIDRP